MLYIELPEVFRRQVKSLNAERTVTFEGITPFAVVDSLRSCVVSW